MNYFRIRNWSTYQHYANRAPIWIKLYTNQIDDPSGDWSRLTDTQRGQLIGLWMLAAKTGNCIPYNADLIADEIMASEPVDLQAFGDHIQVYSSRRECLIASDVASKSASLEGEGEIEREKKGGGEASPSPKQLEMLNRIATERGVVLRSWVKENNLALTAGNVTAIKAALKAIPEPDPAALETARKNEKFRELCATLADVFADRPSDAPDWIRSQKSKFHGRLFGRLLEASTSDSGAF